MSIVLKWLSARFAVALGNTLSQTPSAENTVLKGTIDIIYL